MRAVALALAVLAAGASGAAAKQSTHPCFNGVGRPECLEFLGKTLRDTIMGAVAERGPAPLAADGTEQAWQDVDSKWCPNKSYYEFIPVHLGVATTKDTIAVNGSCFAQTHVGMTIVNETAGEVTFTNDGHATGLLCADTFLVVTREKVHIKSTGALSGLVQKLEIPFVAGEHDDVAAHGADVFILPCGLLGTLTSALKTVALFNGTGMVQDNVNFLTERKVFPQGFTAFNTTQPLDESLIKSGDYLAIMRLDGLDPLVMWGTGGTTGHSAVVVHDPRDNTKYVVESTDANPFGHVYWPPPYGIIRTPLSKWIPQGQAANYHVGLLPLKAEVAAHFDEGTFWKWFDTVKGMPYGYHTFMQSFLDTYPMKNLPEPIVTPTFGMILRGMERLIPPGGHGVNVYSLFIEAINHRLNSTCKTLACVDAILDKKGSNLGEVTALPEMDGWWYDDGKNYSMVCSEFAAHVWKTGLGDYWPVLQAGEQTPKDNYQMGIYDPAYWTKDNCPIGLRTTPAGTYCQLMGEYELPLPGYNTIPVYAGMNNACPAQWPGYQRCPASNPKCC